MVSLAKKAAPPKISTRIKLNIAFFIENFIKLEQVYQESQPLLVEQEQLVSLPLALVQPELALELELEQPEPPQQVLLGSLVLPQHPQIHHLKQLLLLLGLGKL